MGRTCTHIQQSIHGQMQVAMWLEILSLRNIRHTDNRAWLTHATNNPAELFLNFYENRRYKDSIFIHSFMLLGVLLLSSASTNGRWGGQKDVLSYVDPFIGSGGAGFGAGGHNPGWCQQQPPQSPPNPSQKSKNNTNAHTHATRTHTHAHSRAHLKYYVYCDSMVSHQTHWINIDDSQRIMLHAPRRRTNSFWDMQIRT